MMNAARVALPGACGELVQGTLDGVPFLISCPINLWSVVEVRLSDRTDWHYPTDTPKAAAAIGAALRHFGCPKQGGSLRIQSALPRSKGYASSTADVASAVYALAAVLGRPIDPRAVAQLALSIEPSDSIMFPGLALMDHRTGRRFEPLGAAPPLALVLVDEGGTVDTLAFNRVDWKQSLRALAPQHREALDSVRNGLRDGDWAAVGYGATLSALAHQQILPKTLLPAMLKLSRDVGALGICVAHSGTLLGLILDPARHDAAAIAHYVEQRLPAPVGVSRHRVVGGGPRPVQQELGPENLRKG